MGMLAEQVDYVIGVDTHRDAHTAAIVDASTGAVVAQTTMRGRRVGLSSGCCASPTTRAAAVGSGRSRAPAATAPA